MSDPEDTRTDAQRQEDAIRVTAMVTTAVMRMLQQVEMPPSYQMSVASAIFVDAIEQCAVIDFDNAMINLRRFHDKMGGLCGATTADELRALILLHADRKLNPDGTTAEDTKQ